VSAAPIIRRYRMHGVKIETSTSVAALSEALDGRLRYFSDPSGGEPDLRCEYQSVPNAEWSDTICAPQPGFRAIRRTPTLEVWYNPASDRLFAAYEGCMAFTWESTERTAHVRFAESEAGSTWRLSHPMFTLPLVDCMKRHGRYSLHAAALAVEGKGLLFPASSGSGKSTLTLALARAGWDFLSDDVSFLRQDTDELRLLAFPDDVDVTDETLRMFPEISHLLAEPTRPDWRKRQVPATEFFPTRIVDECAPAAVVFPRFAGTDSTRLERISEQAAFFELASNLIPTETAASQRHLDVIGLLIRRVPCYRMHTGRNLQELPELLGELLV
jgi:hypothetical protein